MLPELSYEDALVTYNLKTLEGLGEDMCINLIKGQWQRKMLLFHKKEHLRSSIKCSYIFFISSLTPEIF